MATFTPTGKGSYKKKITSPSPTEGKTVAPSSTVKNSTSARRVGTSSFTPTKYAGTRSSTLRRWQYSSNDALKTINGYISKINNGDYLSSDDIESYRSAVSAYEKNSDFLRRFAQKNGTTFTDQENKEWSDTLSSLKGSVTGASDFYGQFSDKGEYTKWHEYVQSDEYADYLKMEEERNRLIQNALSSPDYEEYRSRGADGYTTYDGKPVRTYEENPDAPTIPNIFRDIQNERLINQFMTDDEIGAYYYYFGKGDRETAEKYRSIYADNDILKKRNARATAEKYNNTLGELIINLGAGVDQAWQGIKNLGSAVTGGEPVSTSLYQYGSAYLSEDNKGVWKAVNDGGRAITNMMPSILAGGYGGQLAGNLVMGASVAGNSYKQMIDEGYTPNQARAYAAMTTASELLIGHVLGGFGQLGQKGISGIVKSVAPDLAQKLSSGITSAALRTVTKVGANMVSEGLEEGVQEALEPVIKLIATGDTENFEATEWSDIAYAALLGATTAGALDGIPRAADAVSTSINAKKAYGANIDTIINTALEIDPDNKLAQSMKNRVDASKWVSGLNIDELITQVDNAKLVAAIETRLGELGETEGAASTASAIAKRQHGEELTSSEKKTLKNSKYAERITNELDVANILNGSTSSEWTQSIDTIRYGDGIYGALDLDAVDTTGKTVATESADTVQNENITPDITTEGNRTATTGADASRTVSLVRDGDTISATIDKVLSVDKNGMATVQLSDGTRATSEELTFSNTSTELVFKAATERVGKVKGFTQESANAMIRAYDQSSGYSVSTFIQGWTQAYDIGAQGGSLSQVNSSPYSSALSPELRQSAYNIGSAIAAGTPSKASGAELKRGSLTYAEGVDPSTFTERQRNDAIALEVVASALGVDIEIFDSPVDENGVHIGENGSYDPKTRKIRIDLHSGVSGEGAMLYIASHELTHYLKDISPNKFNAFADEVIRILEADGADPTELVESKLAQLEESGLADGLSENELQDLAFEEVITDAAESMLTSTDTLKRLSSAVRKRDATLWGEIKSFFSDLIKKIKTAYSRLTPSSLEGARVADMLDAAENARKIWSDAISDLAGAKAPRVKGADTANGTESTTDKHSARGSLDFSNRDLLSRALDSVVQSEEEMVLLDEYTRGIEEINRAEADLRRMRAELRELTFDNSSGVLTKRDQEIQELRTGENEIRNARISDLQEDIARLSDRINNYDKRLFELESTRALRGVLEREKAKAYKKAAEKGRERMHENVERRQKTEYRHQIQSAARELSTLLDKGTKKRNVKTGERPVVRAALDVANALFSTDEDLIVSGIGVEMSDAEAKAVNKYLELYDELHKTDGDISNNRELRATLRTQMWEVKTEFSSLLERERKRLSKASAKESIAALQKAYGELEKAEESYLSGAYKPEVHDLLKTIEERIGEGTTVSEMTLPQLEMLSKAYTMIKYMVSDSNKIFREGRKEELEARVVKVFGEVGGLKGSKKSDSSIPASKIGRFVKDAAGINNLRPVNVFELIQSPQLEELFWDAVNAQDVYVKDTREAADVILKARKANKYETWDIDKVQTFHNASGAEIKLTLGEMMSIYAYSKRPGAVRHLENGGFQFAAGSRYKESGRYRVRSDTTQARTYLLDKTARNAISGALTKEQKAYATQVQRLLVDFGKKGNEVSSIIYGIDLFNDEHYFPIRSSREFIKSEKATLGSTVTSASLQNAGMTNSLIPEATNPIILEPFDDVVSSHIDTMSKYHAYVIPVENLRRVLDYSMKTDAGQISTKTLIQSKLGSDIVKYLEGYLEDINGTHKSSEITSPTYKLFSKAKAASVGLNASVMAQQYFSIIRAMSVVDAKYFLPYLSRTPGASLNIVSTYRELVKHAPVATLKEMGGFDVGTSRGFSDFYGSQGARISLERVTDAIGDISGIGAEAMDKLGWSTIWRAVKAETSENFKKSKKDLGTDEYWNACSRRFTEVVTRTQVYDSVNTRSANMRSQSDLMKMATSFMGEPTVVAGNLTTSFVLFKRAVDSGNKAQMQKHGRALGVTLVTTAIAQLMSSAAKAIVYAGRDDDEDETLLEKYIYALSGAVRDDLNPLGYFPIFRDINSVLSGWSVSRADMDLLESLVKSGSTFLTHALDDKENFALSDALDFAGDLANLLSPLPFKNAIRDITAVANIFDTLTGQGYDTNAGRAFSEGWTSGDSFLDELIRSKIGKTVAFSWAGAPSATRSAMLYESIIRGDTLRLEYYRSTYENEKQYESALKRALRSEDPRISKAAQAMLDGDKQIYYSIVDEIVGEGNFSAVLVVDALKAEYESLKKKRLEAHGQ